MQKFNLEQKLLTILVFCLFKRNRRLLLDSTGDSSDSVTEDLVPNFQNFTIRKFGIVDKGLDCGEKVLGSNPVKDEMSMFPE